MWAVQQVRTEESVRARKVVAGCRDQFRRRFQFLDVDKEEVIDIPVI